VWGVAPLETEADRSRPDLGLALSTRAGNQRRVHRRAIKGATRKTVLLVDDVFTTGATAAECARTLLNAGAAAVRVFTLARTA